MSKHVSTYSYGRNQKPSVKGMTPLYEFYSLGSETPLNNYPDRLRLNTHSQYLKLDTQNYVGTLLTKAYMRSGR